MKIFFQAVLTGEWASGWQRCETLRGLVDEVVPFCFHAFLERAAPKLWRRLMGRARFKQGVVDDFNRSWLEALLACRPDVAWLEWPKLLRAETILQARAQLPHCQFVAFYDDNP